jgi:hypothetical protein
MQKASVIARVAGLAGVFALGVPVAGASAVADTDGSTAPASMVSGPSLRTPASETATVTAGTPAKVAPTSITHGFVGIATSLTTIPALSGSPTDLDTPFLNLVRSLSPGAPPLLRLGGNTSDDSWWPIPGLREPFLNTLSPRWAARVRALLTALRGRAILGVDLEVGHKFGSEIASTEVAEFDRYVGAGLIDAFELGNEPEYSRCIW